MISSKAINAVLTHDYLAPNIVDFDVPLYTSRRSPLSLSEVKFTNRVFNNSEVKGAHFRILLEKVPIFAKNVRFLYHREANKKRHPPLKVAPLCAKAHVIKHSAHGMPR